MDNNFASLIILILILILALFILIFIFYYIIYFCFLICYFDDEILTYNYANYDTRDELSNYV
jgi:hypothetical protein